MIKLEVSGLERLAAKGQATQERLLHAMAAGLVREAEGLMTESKKEVPVDLDALRGSGFVDAPTFEGNDVTVRVGYGGPAAKYAVYVHEGTGPAVGHAKYFPPKEALEGWAKRHGFDDVRAVQWAIYLHGTQPHKYLENPFRRRQSGASARIAATVKKLLK